MKTSAAWIKIGALELLSIESKECRTALKIVYDRFSAGFPATVLENPKDGFTEVVLLVKSESGGEEFLKEREKQNFVRFFIRLLLLEMNWQKPLFKYFYKTI